MKQQNERISKEDVALRTTLVRADGRVVERPDGSRLLVDAYNVLHRDYDALTQEHTALKEENERLTASAAANTSATQDETRALTAKATSLQEDATKARDAISTVRSALGDILSRFFRDALSQVSGTDDVSGVPALLPDDENASLLSEVRLLQRAKDTLIMTLTTAASEHRRGEASSVTTQHHNAALSLNLQESDLRIELYSEEAPAFTAILATALREVPSLRRKGPKVPPSVSTQPIEAKSPAPSTVTKTASTAVRYRHSTPGGAVNPAPSSSPREKGRETFGGSLGAPVHNASPSPTLLFPGRRDASPPAQRTHSANAKTKRRGEGDSPRNSNAMRREASNLDSSMKEDDVVAAQRKDSALPSVGVLLEVGGKVVATSTDAFNVGDIIMSGDGRTVITQQDLYSIISQSATGVVVCRVRRNGQNRTVEFKVKHPRPSVSEKNRKSKDRHIVPASRPKSKTNKKIG